MHRTWKQDLRTVKALLEHDTSTVSEPEPTADESIERVPVPDLCALWAETSTAPMNIALIGAVEAAPLVAPDGTVALDASAHSSKPGCREHRCCCEPCGSPASAKARQHGSTHPTSTSLIM
jgi:hypothetical protein